MSSTPSHQELLHQQRLLTSRFFRCRNHRPRRRRQNYRINNDNDDDDAYNYKSPSPPKSCPLSISFNHPNNVHKQMMMMMMIVLPAALTVLSSTVDNVSFYFIPSVSAHGYLKTPRSRNIIAYQDKNWATFLSGNGANNDPEPEDLFHFLYIFPPPHPSIPLFYSLTLTIYTQRAQKGPHCLNRGGSLAQCGTYFERNYDTPRNSRGRPMPPNVQATYTAGSIIEIDVMVTTHHRGHFEFAICPIIDHHTAITTNAATPSSPTTIIMPIPTKECFDENKLTFLSDELYGAPPDVNYPKRGYLAPASYANWTNGDPAEQPVFGAAYKMRYQLPTSSLSSTSSRSLSSSSSGVVGDLVLLQWYYLTANSCKHDGYDEYPFPAMWGKDVDFYPGLPECEHVPEDGNGVPEQFWNCAEIRIVSSDDKSPVVGGQQQQHDDDDEDTSSSSLPSHVVGTTTVIRPTRPDGSDVVIVSESSTKVVTSAAEKELAMPLESEPLSTPRPLLTPPPPRPTKIPTQNPITSIPTRQPTPKPIRQTRRPTTPRPTLRPTPPTRRPSKRPTSRPSSSYSVLTLYQNNKPTRRPQHQQKPQQKQRPRTPKPTRKPTTRRPTKNYVMLSPSESYIVPVLNNNNNNKPSKGQEQQQSSPLLGNMISNQITTAAAAGNNKKDKMPKRQQQITMKQKQKLKRQKKKENMLEKKRKRQEKRNQKKQSNYG